MDELEDLLKIFLNCSLIDKARGIVERSSTKMEPTGSLAEELGDELIKFTAIYEERKINTDMVVDQSKEVHESMDLEVNITECTKSGGRDLVEAEYGDVTESSSSFGNSDSDVENVDPSDDSEIQSDFCAKTVPVLNFDGCSEPIRLRKKKLTDHWRSFIEPLTWRCKWTELQILKFESQARKYDRELEEHNQKKKVKLQNYVSEGHSAKSCQFPLNKARSDIHRQRKRKRTEETMDVAQYMSQHNLFSYYENRKYLAKGLLKDDELKNRAISIQNVDVDNELWITDEQSFFESGEGDNSKELVLGKIELLRSQIADMKSRIEKVLSEEAGKFPFIDDTSLTMPVKALTSSSQDTSSKNGDRMPVGTFIASQLMSEQNIGDLLVPENAVTSHGEMLPDVNRIAKHVCFDEIYRKVEDEVLIDNKRVKEEMISFEEVKIESGPSPLMPNDELDSTTMKVSMAEADPPMDNQPSPKIRSISKLTTAPKAQRKGRKRKGAGRRGRRSSTS